MSVLIIKKYEVMTKEEELYYTTIGHIEDTGVLGSLDIRALSSIGIPAYTVKIESTNIEEFLEKVNKVWIKKIWDNI